VVGGRVRALNERFSSEVLQMKLRTLFFASLFFACRYSSQWSPAELAIVVSPNEEEAVRWAAEDLRLSIEQATGVKPALVTSAASATQAHLLLVGAGDWECPALAPEETALLPFVAGDTDGLRLCGGDGLGRQYAVYQYLFGLGFRFVHPEQTVVPALQSLPIGRPQSTPETTSPELSLRGFHIHTQHPLELLEALLTNNPAEVELAERYIDWLVRNQQNTLQWILLDSVPINDTLAQAERVVSYAHRRGVKVIGQTSFLSNQQNAHRLVDPSNALDDIEELKQNLDVLLTVPWDAINANLGASEFSPTDSNETILFMNEAADHLELTAGIPFYPTNHVPAGLFAKDFGINFFDLPKFANPNVGTAVHTTMFYGLTGSAPVYGNTDFSRQREFLVDQVDDRSIIYFPESAWWLTFDNAIPVFLPVYLSTRADDLNFVSELGGVDGHITFSSGWEWGYWLTDYLIAHQSTEPSARLADTMQRLLSPLGEKAIALLSETIEAQREALLEQNLMPFLSGEDTLTEIGLRAGIIFHSIAPIPSDVMRMSEIQLTDLNTQLNELAGFCNQLSSITDGWLSLVGTGATPFSPRLPSLHSGAAGRPAAITPQALLEELRDSTQITTARCQNALLNYQALVSARSLELNLPTNDDPGLLLQEAAELTELARVIIAQRERAYRYDASRTSGHAEAGGEGVPNATDYDHRVYGRTHILFFWERRDELVQLAINGEQTGLSIAPQQFLAGSEMTVDARTAGFDEDTLISITWGDGASDTLTASDSATISHLFPSQGQLISHLEATAENQSIILDVPISVATEIFTIPADNIHVTVPNNPIADNALRAFLPTLLFGVNLDDPASFVLSIGLDIDQDGETDSGTVLHLPPGTKDNSEHVLVQGFTLKIPVTTSTGSLGSLFLQNAVLNYDLTTTTTTGDTLTNGRLGGAIQTDELVGLLVNSGVIEPDGALDILASVFTFDPQSPPAFLIVELSFNGTRTAQR
jgi:hypothetical protein